MLGFAVYIPLQATPPEFSFQWKDTFEFQSERIIKEVSDPNFHFQQNINSLTTERNFFIDSKDHFFVTEGMILNFEAYKGPERRLFDDPLFFKDFRGHFCGFHYDRQKKSAVLFNDHAGTQKIYYYKDEYHFLASTDLYTLNRGLKDLMITVGLNEDAASLLLTSGFMHENLTLFEEIHQLRAGEYLYLVNNRTDLENYYHLGDFKTHNISYKDAIDGLEEKFNRALELEFSSGNQNRSYTTLSGGLDSRMVAMGAYDLGYTDQSFLNFSEKGYADEKIASSIARSLNCKLHQVTLNPETLINIDDVVRVNDGQTLYSGSAHVFNALQQLGTKDHYMIHSGMIGDAVMGSFLKGPEQRKPDIGSGLYSKGLYKRASGVLKESAGNYETEELYKFYNRAFLGANNGFQYFDLSATTTSPFLEPDFMAFAYSLPPEFRYNSRIYTDWIRKYHPGMTKFTWEAIGGKPSNSYTKKQWYRYKRALIKRLPVKTMWKRNMNPEQYWYDKNPHIKTKLDDYFREFAALLDPYSELKEEVVQMYKQGDITEKTQVLTLLAALKLHKL